MALTASKVSSSIATSKMTILPKQHGVPSSVSMTIQPNELQFTCQAGEPRQLHYGCFLTAKTSFSSDALWRVCGKPVAFNVPQRPSFLCLSKAEERCRTYGDCADITRTKIGDEEDESPVSPHGMDSSKGLSEACRFIYNDAKFVNERARSDIVLLSRGIMRLDARARQDVAMLGSEFLKLDARAREDTEKIDRNVKKKAERLQHIATILKDKAQTRLKSAADKHWSDGALEADLRRADFRAKQRAMEDTIMALEFVKNIHEMMVQKVYKFPMRRENNPQSAVDKIGCIMLEKNGRTVDYFPGEVSTDRITIIQEAYKSMASALSEADGIDYTDPEELELLIATLIDLDAMDGKSSVSLLVECSSSPDVNTRQALANALAAAPSMWTLGNAGMGALQRLAEDSNPVIAAAAFKTICELKKQWEIEEGDSYRFMMNEINEGNEGNGEVDNDTNRT